MATVQDRDIAIWVCPKGETNDVIEFVPGGPEPIAKVCGLHGEPFHKRCPNADCPNPIYHPSDLDQNFHKPCGAKIPWASMRSSLSQLLGYEAFNSTLLGTGSYLGKTYTPPRELTAEDRQDLINPPSLRLPAERVRVPESRQPTGQDEMPATKRWLDKATEPRTTWDQLERGESTGVVGKVRQIDAAVTTKERSLVRRVAGFFGKSVSKGVEEAVVFVVKWGLLAALVLIGGLFGYKLVFQ